MKSLSQKKKEFISHCREIAEKEMSWGASGNFSMRVDKKKFLVTASGSHFGRMRSGSIAQCRICDDTYLGSICPSVEHNMHRGIYAVRPDVHYIVHVHPLFSVLMISAQNVRMNFNIIPEAEHYLGSIAHVPYIAAGTKKLATAVKKKARNADIIIMKNHGVVALGENFADALCRAEAFEFIAKLNYYALLGKIKLPKLK